MTIYSAGDKVMVGKRKPRRGIIIEMRGATKAVVAIDTVAMDEDDVQVIDVRTLYPYYDDPSDQQKRAHAARRMLRQGIRLFRFGAPDGPVFVVDAIVSESSKGAVAGHIARRKRIQFADLQSLFPNR